MRFAGDLGVGAAGRDESRDVAFPSREHVGGGPVGRGGRLGDQVPQQPYRHLGLIRVSPAIAARIASIISVGPHRRRRTAERGNADQFVGTGQGRLRRRMKLSPKSVSVERTST
ncbi:hypothetical protein GCM10009827_087930 [Dactylosporangium maewongense]|uniref:Uncharacterized protein n=1 Tax=Dactylosporangium maewongense TaxID=634393 RepID=A0ABP4N0K0_9ACTN